MIPCKDCITFPVCKAQFNIPLYYEYDLPHQYNTAHRLVLKCSLLKSYLTKHQHDSDLFLPGLHSLLNPAVEFFNNKGDI